MPRSVASMFCRLFVLFYLIFACHGGNGVNNTSNENSNDPRLILVENNADNEGYPCELFDPITGHVRPHKLVVFVDAQYISLFQNWMVYYTAVCGNASLHNANLSRVAKGALELVCLDGAVSSHLERLGLQCSAKHSDPSFRDQLAPDVRTSALWMKRLEIITEILSTGSDLILSDTDAFWLRNPYPDLSRLAAHSHIVASRGWYPFKFSRRWGSTLCMGFLYVKAGAFSIEFFHQVWADMASKQLQAAAYQHFLASNETIYRAASHGHNETIVFDPERWKEEENKIPDDQFSANLVLDRMQISWPPEMQNEERQYHHVGTLQYKEQTYNVTLLAESRYVRNCLGNPLAVIDRSRFPSRTLQRIVRERTVNATIIHCLVAPGDSRRKRIYLLQYHLWRLPFAGRPQDLLAAPKTSTRPIPLP